MSEVNKPGFFSILKDKYNEFINKLATDIEYRINFIRTIGLLLFISVCGAVLYFASNNKNALGTDTFFYAIIVIISLIIILTIFLPVIMRESNALQFIIMFLLSLGFIGAVAYSCIQLTTQSVGIINYMLNGLLVLGFIIGLGLFFLAIGNSLKQQKGWIGFMVNLIFYVPCLVMDYVKYLTREFRSTVNYIYILYAVEIIIVLAYIYLPKLISYIFLTNGFSILAEPVFLDIYQSIPLGSLIIEERKGVRDLTTQNDPIIYRSSFALTMWFYINSQTTIDLNKEYPIMSFGNRKPRITYFYDNTNSMKPYTLKVYFTNNNNNNTPAFYQFNLPSQKWNYITFNYTANLVDFFINGKLVYTFQFNESNMPIFSGSDKLEIGSDSGVNGSICNVKYFKENLTRGQIANEYNLYMYSNPPSGNKDSLI